MSCQAAHMLCMVKQPSTFLTLYRPTIVSATAAYSRVKSRRLKRNVIERVDRQRKKSTNPVLEVPKQMTIKQISQVTGRSRDNVIDVIHYVDSDFFKAKHFDRVGVTFPNLAGVLRKLG
uniref:Uncharacterized protein n=1 Tax=Ciona savignyi TaxID=51511 RepID=H2YR97_CIOSA